MDISVTNGQAGWCFQRAWSCWYWEEAVWDQSPGKSAAACQGSRAFHARASAGWVTERPDCSFAVHGGLCCESTALCRCQQVCCQAAGCPTPTRCGSRAVGGLSNWTGSTELHAADMG